MMLRKINVLTMVFSVLALALAAFSQSSYADWAVGVSVGEGDHHDDHHFYRWHDHPHYGYRLHFLPAGYYTVWANGVMCYYYDGLYYVREGPDYVLVNPPVGAYVNAIPPDFRPVNINGRIYYTDDGVYYILTHHRGYKVVPAPVVYRQPQQVIVIQPAAPPVDVVDTQNSFTVNIPNSNGSYTPVVIKKSGNGYVGPQGEFYATFPTVSQLKAMYVKQ